MYRLMRVLVAVVVVVVVVLQFQSCLSSLPSVSQCIAHTK